MRRKDDPGDLSDLVPKRIAGRYAAAEWVLKAQWEAQKVIPNTRTVILRDIATHPMNVHYDTAGQLRVGTLFAKAAYGLVVRVGGRKPTEILTLLGAKGRAGVTVRQLESYRRIFGFIDANGDGQHSKKEFIEDGRYLTPTARAGIFRASDANSDDMVTVVEYVDNRIITDEAKAIFEDMDTNDDGTLTKKEFLDSGKIKDKDLAKAVFAALDSDGNGETIVPEYLRVWGRWARSGSRG